MYCKQCGREQRYGEKFCGQCGAPYNSIGKGSSVVFKNVVEQSKRLSSVAKESMQSAMAESNIGQGLSKSINSKWKIPCASKSDIISFYNNIPKNRKTLWTVLAIIIIVFVWGISKGTHSSHDNEDSDYTEMEAGESNGYTEDKHDYMFYSPADVFGYLAGRKFCSDNMTIEIRQDGIYVNGSQYTSTVQVLDMNEKRALVEGVSPYNHNTFKLLVDCANGYLRDPKDGTIYYEK